MPGEQGPVEARPLGDVTFLVVMADQRDPAPNLLLRIDAHGCQPAAQPFPSRKRNVACTFRLS